MIRDAKKSAGLTQRQFSELLEIPIDVVKSWDSGRRNPPKWAEKLIIEKIKEYQEGNMKVTLTQEEISQIMTALTIAKMEAEESIKTANGQNERELRESTAKKWGNAQREIGLKLGYYSEQEKSIKKENAEDIMMAMLKS